MSVKNGGSAFPVVKTTKCRIDDADVHSTGGMTLRDYFAAKAMQGILADHETTGEPEPTARLAYATADAMLAARCA